MRWDHVLVCACQAKQLKHGVSIVADLTKEEDMKRAIQETIEKLGGLDILVNRSGLYCTSIHTSIVG